MIFEFDELAEAIYFFGHDGRISKEMMNSEFEAVLDGYVPMADLSNTEAKAVYLNINSSFHIKRAVFFKIKITESGMVDKSWRVPINHLASVADYGPDMGSGPIQLACYSQSPVAHYKNDLWDPCIEPKKHQLHMLKKQVSHNRLSLQFKIPANHETANTQAIPPTLHMAKNDTAKATVNTSSTPTYNTTPDATPNTRPSAATNNSSLEQKITQKARKEYAQEYKSHVSQLLNDQRMRTQHLEADHQNAIRQLKDEQQNQQEHLFNKIKHLEHEFTEAMIENKMLHEKTQGQADKINGLRDYYEHKIKSMQGQELAELQDSKVDYEQKLQVSIEAALEENKEILQMRDTELCARNELEAQLRDEITQLRHQLDASEQTDVDQKLLKMMEKGISLVTYQPGAGHLTLPLSALSHFMENPASYAAEYCGVDEKLYIAWARHYHMPICTAKQSNADVCADDIPRVEKPSDFIINHSELCEKHQKQHNLPHLRLAGE